MEADEINGAEPVYPDGLTPEVIERLLDEAAVFWSEPSRATTALLNGSTVQRRNRRTTRREIGAVVRALPARLPHAVSPRTSPGEVA